MVKPDIYQDSILLIFIKPVDSSEDLFPTGGQTVNRTACEANIYGDCCYQSIDIQIKDCGCYYVYHLRPTSGCYSAYCFGRSQ